VITNIRSESYKSIVLTQSISDHFPLLYFLSERSKKPKPKFIETKDFSKKKIENFNSVLNNINWKPIEDSEDVQTAFNNFSDTFFSLYNIHFPVLKIKFNKNFHKIEPWMTPGLLTSRSTKFSLSSAFSKNPSNQNKVKYNSYRNLYNRLLKSAKKLYFDNQFKKFSNNLKKTWDLLKFAINSEGKSSLLLSELFVDGIRHSEPQIIAEKLNEFFVNAPGKIVSEIPECDNPFDEKVTNQVFSLSNSPVTRTEILDAVKQLQSKKSEDLYGISMCNLKLFIPALINPLYHIIFKSFETGEFPSQLKIAKIIPLYKSGDKTLPDNYRPISLLPNFSKIIEKVMSNRLTHYLESNNLLCQEQFGFRKAHSTLHPLVHFLNNISQARNQNKYTIAIFCDLRKAFDTVDHQILLKKLFNLGIKGIELQWFKSYLSNRKQFVHLNGKNSSLLTILLGVPQGSILGPLLFLIYINDLPSCNDLINSLFADDTMLLDSHESLPLLTSKINKEFQKVITYFNVNKLSLHMEKTKFMLFFKNKGTPSPDILFNYNALNSTSQDPNLISKMICINDLDEPKIKFLGVTLDPFLTFKDHIVNINSKLATGLFFLRSAKNILNEKSLKYLYYALIHCHIIYAIHVYSSASESLLKMLYVKQKNAIRIISKSKYNAHTEPLFKKLQILPFPKLCEFFKLQFMFYFKRNLLPSSFNSTWSTNRIRRQNQSEIVLRNDNSMCIPYARTNTLSKFPLAAFPKLWEEFPDENIKFVGTKEEFNLKLKNHFLNELNNVPVCNRLLCPACHLR
jgi:hypothetical protein